MIQAVDPSAIKFEATSIKSSSVRSDDFASLMSNAAPATAEAVAVNSGDMNSASLTHAAITGMAGGAQAYSYPGALGSGTTYGGGVYNGVTGTGAGYTGGATGAGYGSESASGVDPLMMTQAIRDMNMEMIGLQSAVQNEARFYTTWSNVKKTEHDMAMNSIRNVKALG